METEIKPLVCIIGAGVGGTITALELLKTGKFRVLVVDVDTLENSGGGETYANLEYRSTGKEFNQLVTRGIGFGGGSNVWHGVVSELDDEDWAAFDSHCGYPVSIEVNESCEMLTDYFDNLHQLFRGNGTAKEPESDSFYDLIHKSGQFRKKDFYIQLSPLRCRKLLQTASRLHADLTVLEHGIALGLKPGATEPQKVNEMVVYQRDQRKIVNADIFVLAAGSIESPRILLQSINEFGLTLESTLTGKYLTDHPWAVIGMIKARSGNLKMHYSDVRATSRYRYRVGYRLASTHGNNEILNSCISFKPLFMGEYEQFKNALKALITSRFSPRDMFQLIRQHSFKDLIGSGMTLIAEKFALGVSVKRCMVFCYLEQPAYEDSCVVLSGKYDSVGRDIPLVHWKISETELDSVFQFQQYLAEAFSDEGSPEFKPNPVTLKDFTTGAHHAGTLRIGASPNNGVIDKDLGVFGLNNLFVADLSLFPCFGNANPTFTLCGFARRLALHIEATYAG